nr:hypothetical protein [Propionibacterium sp.]
MSGPKGASYRVVSEAELRRRAAEAARARVRACAQQVEELLLVAGHDAVKAGRRPALAARSDALDALAAEERAGQEYLERLRQVVAERRRSAAAAHLTAALGTLAIDIDFTATHSRRTPTPTPKPDQRARLDALASRLVDVDDGDLPALTEAIRAAAAALDTADAGRAAQIVAAVQLRVSDALHRAQDRAALAVRRAALAREFADVPPDDPAAVAAAAASDEHGLARARTLLQAARDRRRRAADQEFVVDRAVDALRALGYRVEAQHGGGLDTLVARKDAWPHHGLRLFFPESEPAFTTVPEAYGATDARDDAAFERATCGDVDALVARLTAGGVPTELRLRRAPGTVALRRLGDTQQQPAAAVPAERERAL